MSSKQLQVIGIVFPGFNILDLTGPTEVFGSSQIPTSERRITIASATDVTKSSEGVSIKRDLSFIELLAQQADGSIELSKYDIFLVPGGPAQYVHAALEDDGGLSSAIKAFAAHKDDGKSRWLFSVCSGAGFIGAVGLFDGLTVTTHWSYLDTLRDVCAKAGTSPNVVRKRWVNVGSLAKGSGRIVTAGGVSCGIDAALWITSEISGMERAVKIATAMDYDWKYGKLEVTDGYIV